MKKRTSIIVFFLFVLLNLNAQGDTLTKAYVDELFQSLKTDYNNELETLRSQIKDLEEEALSSKKESYETLKNNLESIAVKIQIIEGLKAQLELSTDLIKLHKKITQINNIKKSGDELGIDIEKEILGKVDALLLKEIEIRADLNEREREQREQRKENFKNIVKTIIGSSVVTGLANSNPVSAIAHSIISQSLSEKTVKVDEVTIRGDKKWSRNYSDQKQFFEENSLEGFTGSENTFKLTSVQAFSESIQSLISVYDALAEINSDYSSKIDVFAYKATLTYREVDTVLYKFYSILEIEKGATVKANRIIQDLLHVDSNPTVEDLNAVLENKQVLQLLDLSGEIISSEAFLKRDLKSLLKTEIELCEKYIDFFKELRDSKGMNVDKEKIAENISEFNDLQQKLEAHSKDK